MESLLASDTPVWMHLVSEYAEKLKIPLNQKYFTVDFKPNIQLYNNVLPFLKIVKTMENCGKFKKQNIKIYHFIITAGLKSLVESFFSKEETLIERVFGCEYKVETDPLRNIPIFCMDETTKTRAIFEVSKGTPFYKNRRLNQKFLNHKLWCPLENMIYIGDGPTDIPVLSVIRKHGGMGVIVYNPQGQNKKKT